ncbi:MAG: NAD(P)H-hydrate epimerase [Planctomycetota bacterium]|nr:NAD(P)H-hydrate epimerase [Planctomycetota bacterium]
MDNSAGSQYLSICAARRVDQYAINVLGIAGAVLMENAARGCVDLLEKSGIAGPVVVVCGTGNNGGDGFAIARHLLVRNYDATAILIGDPEKLGGDAKANFECLRQIAPDQVGWLSSIDKPELQQLLSRVVSPKVDWIVDAILGTGTQGKIREPRLSVINAINDSPAKVFAVDIPSGLDGDSGESLDATVQAQITATFVSKKQGFKNPEAARFLGKIRVLDIGIPDFVVANALDQKD